MKAKDIKQSAMSAIRAVVLFVIFGFGFICLFAETDGNSQWSFEIFLFSKAIAAITFYIFYKLCRLWSKSDKWLKAYDELCDKTPETNNYCYLGKEDGDL